MVRILKREAAWSFHHLNYDHAERTHPIACMMCIAVLAINTTTRPTTSASDSHFDIFRFLFSSA